MSGPENPAAFLRDYFAIHAPAPSANSVSTQRGLDRGRNPFNEKHKPKIRSDEEIEAYLRYRFADAMLTERKKAGGE